MVRLSAATERQWIFEDFFDSKPKAVVTFWRIVNQRLATAARARQRAVSST